MCKQGVDIFDAKDKAGLGYGDAIPGSKLFRTFCGCCATPMRGTDNQIDFARVYGYGGMCERCDPPHRGVGNDVQIEEPQVERFVDMLGF
jgi:hypothetical protein